jgi:cytochrome c-type biogenesis protein CcmH/NrfF
MRAGTGPIDRRTLIGRTAAFIAGASPLAAALVAQQPEPAGPLAGQGDAGTLRDPAAAGRSRTATGAGDNDETIKRIEHQLKCTCGCNLDIFTCRTTDFTCTYSPELHREVVALHAGGRTPQEVIDAFVAKYGERVLMAPKPVDFNLVGYLLPGAAVLAGGAALAWVIGRRQRGGRAGGQAGGDTASGAAVADGPPGPSAGPPIRPSDEELDRLRHDLAEVED